MKEEKREDKSFLLLFFVIVFLLGFLAGVTEFFAADSWVNQSNAITPNASWSENVNISGKLYLPGNVTASIGGSLLLAGACTNGTTVIPGAKVTHVVLATPNTYPGDGVQWQGYVSSNDTVTVKVCALIAVTPVSSAYNVRVVG